MSTTSEIVERLRLGTANSLHPMCLNMQAAAARLDELERENAKLRSLCAEAAALYSQGGVFPINGEMSERLRRASKGGEQ
jgi:hypothetical protein